jgi:hypothetical protein
LKKHVSLRNICREKCKCSHFKCPACGKGMYSRVRPYLPSRGGDRTVMSLLPLPAGRDANGSQYTVAADGTLAVDAQPLAGVRVQSLPSCGLDHCIALGLAGEVFSWATGREGHRFGQLGWGKAGGSELYTPRRVELPALATAVAAGACHSAVIDEQRQLWVFGSDRWFQLGQNKPWSRGSIVQRAPVRVGGGAGAIPVVGVACGEDHTLALDDTGQVWAWGRGEHGQLFGASGRQFTAPPKRSSALTGREGAVAVAAAGHCSCSRLVGSAAPRCTGKCSERARQLLLCQMGHDG